MAGIVLEFEDDIIAAFRQNGVDMNLNMRRIAGVFGVLVAAGSLLVSAFALLQTWRLRPTVTAEIQSNLQVISATLSTTEEGLLIASESLTSTQRSIDGLQATVNTLGKSIDDTTPMLRSLAVLMREDLPETVSSAQTSLGSAQQSAKIIDAVLRALTFFNPSLYKPSVPLDQALGQVSQSMADLPGSFKTIELGLQNTQVNLTMTRLQIEQIAGQIGQINDSLEDAQKVIGQYQRLVGSMQSAVAKISQRIPTVVDALAWSFSFLLFWLGVSQAGLLSRAWTWARRE